MFLLENFLVYIISLYFYIFIFLFKYIRYKIFLKETKKIVYKNRFNFLKNDFLIFFKNILLEYPKSRAFFNFYNFGKLINKKNKTENKLEILKNLIITVLNRYLILIITGVPYSVIFCNTWFVNKFFLIQKLKKKKQK